jgi:Fe-S cluster biogenesis protein NfuA
MVEERTKEEVIKHIKHLIETNVKPAVASHGGVINFISFNEGKLLLELGGACSGCAGSTMTLKMGVENMIKHYVPEVKTVEAQNDPTSTVDPYYTDPSMFNDWETQEKGEGHNEPNN